MKKKVFDFDELKHMTVEEVIDKIRYENYSLLTTLGADNLRKEMVPVGKICNYAVNYVLGTTMPGESKKAHTKRARAKLVKHLRKLTPGVYEGFPHDRKNGLVVGFNHPSLGEIARILMMKIDVMGDKPMLFPVNLPWYEALATDYDRIFQLGIIITPTITPLTWKKMNLQKGTPEFIAGSRLKREFRDLYTNLSHKTLKDGGVIFVAPSATRQQTVFESRAAYDRKKPIIPTMSVLALDLYKDPKIECDFVPMAILPPQKYKKGLNFFKKYYLIPGDIITASEIRNKYYKEGVDKLPDFDWDFHMKIAEKLPKKYWYK